MASEISVYLANPQKDWENRRNIYWGTTSSNATPIIWSILDQIRTGIIEHNFKSKEPFVFTLGPIQAQHQPRSYLQIFKATLGSMTTGRWINTAALLAFVAASGCLTVATTYYGVNFITKRYDQMSRGLLSIYPKNATSFEMQYLEPIRLYNKLDFFDDCFMACSGPLMSAAVSIVGFVILPKDTLFSVYRRVKQPYRVVQELKKLPSSMSGFDLGKLANEKEGQMWSDPITQKEIPEAEICSPRILRIQNHAFDLESVLKRIFIKPLENKMIWHPYFNGYMSLEVQQKLVQDISAFFCISKEAFLDCWNAEIHAENLPANLLKADLLILARTIKFLELIPNEAIRNNLAPILLRGQRALVTELSKYPRSLVYIELFGHPRFSVQRFLDLA